MQQNQVHIAAQQLKYTLQMKYAREMSRAVLGIFSSQMYTVLDAFAHVLDISSCAAWTYHLHGCTVMNLAQCDLICCKLSIRV